MESDELTRQIIGCAYHVHNALGRGFVEAVYENSMVIELRKRGLKVEQQYPIKVHYDGHVVGKFEADLFVAGAVIVELKAVSTVLQVHEVQLVNYLKATGIDVGLLLNFGDQKVEVRRKLRVLPENDDSE